MELQAVQDSIPEGSNAADPASVASDSQQLPGREDQLTIYSYSIGILEKQYGLYNWCETKVRTLVTVNGILLGAMFLRLTAEDFPLTGWVNILLAVGTVAFFTISLVLCLYHLSPRMWSGRIEDRKHLRTVRGTERYSSNEEYYEALVNLKLDEMIRLNCDQIRGMNKNIWADFRAIQRAVISTIGGLILMLIILGRAYL